MDAAVHPWRSLGLRLCDLVTRVQALKAMRDRDPAGYACIDGARQLGQAMEDYRGLLHAVRETIDAELEGPVTA